MRFGVVAEEGTGALADLLAVAGAAEAAGLDLLWLPERRDGDGGWSAPLVAAAALGGVGGDLRVGVEVDLGAVNPLHVAEDAIVADLALGGRLVLGVRPAAGAADRFGEAVGLLLRALAPRPFAFAGPTWPTPAHVEGNTFNLEERLRVTPAPAQTELPVWVAGDPAVAGTYGLAPLVAVGEPADAVWEAVESALGPAALRLRRPALRPLPTGGDGGFDTAGLAADLHDQQRRWGLDTAVLRLDAALEPDARAAALYRVGSRVRPLVQIDRLPDGLTTHWDATLPP